MLPRAVQPRLLTASFLALLASLAAGQQVVPDSITNGEGYFSSGALKGLYAIDSNAYVRNSAPESGTNNQVASFYASFKVPVGTKSALLHLNLSVTVPNASGNPVPATGCVLQGYIIRPNNGGEDLGFAPVPTGSGVFQIPITGAQLDNYRDATTGEVTILARLYRPPSSGSGVITWSTDQMAVLTAILPNRVDDRTGTTQQALSARSSLYAVDGTMLTWPTAHEDGSNNQVTWYYPFYKLPVGAPGAILHVVSGIGASGGTIQTSVIRPNMGGVYLSNAPLANGQGANDFTVTGAQIAQWRDPDSGNLAFFVGMYLPPATSTDPNSTSIPWNTDQAVVYALPSAGPALPTDLAATLDATSGVDLTWTDNSTNETGFVIERKGGADADFRSIHTTGPNEISYQDNDGLAAGTAYTYRVHATNASGDSPSSNEASVTMPGSGNGGGNGGTSFGMSATVIGAKEIAGTDPSQHVCQVLVRFSGGAQSTTNDTYTWMFSTTGAVVSSAGVANGTVLTFNFPASTTLGPTFDGVLLGHRTLITQQYNQSTGQWTSVQSDFEQKVTYHPFRLRQFPMDAVAVDSRKTYAPPNKDGAYPAIDPNADLRSVAFAGWSYHGGLFVGNAAGVNGDQSGVARVQCQATDPGSLPSGVYTLSLLQIGTPAFFRAGSTQWDGALTLEAFVPTSASPNLPAGDVTWTTAMDPAAATSVGTVDLASVPLNEYLNLSFNSGFPSRVLLKATDESAPAWRYFCGTAFSPSYPYSECKPHLWECDLPAATGGPEIPVSGGGNFPPPSGGGGGSSSGGGTTSPGGGTTSPGGGTTPAGGPTDAPATRAAKAPASTTAAKAKPKAVSPPEALKKGAPKRKAASKAAGQKKPKRGAGR